MTAGPYHFVVFSDDWQRHPSSCQHLFKHIAKDHRVLWVNTLGIRAAKADAATAKRALEKCRQWLRGLKRIDANLAVLSPVMLPLAGPGLFGRLNTRLTVAAIRRAMRRLGIVDPILFTSVPTAADYLGKLNERLVAYYVTDDYTTYPGADPDKIRQADRQLTAAADVIFPCSEVLAADRRNPFAETILLPHGVDFDLFATPAPEPGDLAHVPRPRACFFGLIYEKIDLAALEGLATTAPNLQLVMIGPVKTNVDQLAGKPNVHFLDAKPYRQLPAYLHAMDVLLLPYVLDDETTHKAPLKVRECLAVGKPIVARAIPDLEPLADCLHLYADPADLARTVQAALGTDRTARMRDRVRADTWPARASAVLAGFGRRRCDNIQITTDPPPDWPDYLRDRPDATIFHDPRWPVLMRNVYGNEAFYLTARRNHAIVGTVGLVFQKSILFGAHLTSLPYFDAVGIVADDPDAVCALLAEARHVMRRLNADAVELRHAAPMAELATRTDKVTFTLATPDDPDVLWNQFRPKVRNQIRKAQRCDLTVHTGQAELLDDFHALYARNMRDLASPPHGRRFFARIVDTFPAETTLFVVRDRKTPVAAAFTLTDRHAMHVPWAAGDRRHAQRCPNMFLYWSMLAHACRHGIPAFDFGRSTRDSGTYRFKTQWGAPPTDLHWQYLTPPDTPLPDRRADSPKYRLFTAAWKRLPVPLAKALGPRLIAKLA